MSTVPVGDHRFGVRGKPAAVRGGMAHYWRLDRDGAREAAGLAREPVEWVERRHPRCSFGLVTDRDGARELLSAGDKPATMSALAVADRLTALPIGR